MHHKIMVRSERESTNEIARFWVLKPPIPAISNASAFEKHNPAQSLRGFFTDSYQILISGMLVALIVCYLFSVLVGVTIKRLIGDELQELRLQSNATADRLEMIDRKVTAVLRDALEQRQARTQTLPFRPLVSARNPETVRSLDSIGTRNQIAKTINK